MRMAKTQKATLDPSKISGRCGRLMCCLRYEDTTYEVLRKKLPRKNTWVRTEGGVIGRVVDTQIITQLVKLQVLDGTFQAVANDDIVERNLDAPPKPEPSATPRRASPSGPHLASGSDLARRQKPRPRPGKRRPRARAKCPPRLATATRARPAPARAPIPARVRRRPAAPAARARAATNRRSDAAEGDARRATVDRPAVRAGSRPVRATARTASRLRLAATRAARPVSPARTSRSDGEGADGKSLPAETGPVRARQGRRTLSPREKNSERFRRSDLM